MPPDSPAPAADSRRPWMGLAAFTTETQRFFFGRDAEIADMFLRVREHPLTILYGQSGLGKSSLLGAGLLPKLNVEGFRPVLVRLRFGETDGPLLDQIRAALGIAPSGTLWEHFHHLPSRSVAPTATPPVLVFDQFEEVFTLAVQNGREMEVDDLFTQLADLVENRPPAALQDRFRMDRRLARDYEFTPSPTRVVLTLREDYLSHLEQRKGILPSLMRNRMALQLLNGPQALEAVVRPGELDGPPLVDRETGAAIVRFVAKQGAGTPLEEIGAVPPLLSLVCERLNEARISSRLDRIDRDQVEAQSGDILQSFYEDSFRDQPPTLRRFVEDRMITKDSGYRVPVAREEAAAHLRSAGVEAPEEVIDRLVQRRLVSSEERGGLPMLEITHDVLAPLVVRSRDERKERERAEEEARRAASLEQERRRLFVLVLAFAGFAVLAVAGMFYGFHQARVAAEQRDAAWLQEGKAWMLRAEVALERGKRFPDTLLYAAQAIGFDGVGRPAEGEEPRRFIRPIDPEYQEARDWIADHPAYLPVWSSAVAGAFQPRTEPQSDGAGKPRPQIALSPSTATLALGSSTGIRIFNLTTGQETTLPGLTGITDLDYAPDGTLAIAAAEGVHLHAGTTTSVIQKTPVTSLSWSPAGDLLAASAPDGTILLWKNGSEALPSIQQPASMLAHSPENSFLAALVPGAGPRLFFPDYAASASSWEGLTRDKAEGLDGLEQEEFRSRVALAQTATCVAVDPDGKLLVTGTADGNVVLWDAEKLSRAGQVSPEQRHGKLVTAVAYRPDGAQIASASEDGTIKLWEIAPDALRVVATLTGHRGPVTAVTYAPGGGLLATAGADGTAKLWDVRGEKGVDPDLFTYVDRTWYDLEPEAAWGTGKGFANLTPESIGGRWMASPRDLAPVWEGILREKRWRRAELLRDQGVALPGDVASALSIAILPIKPQAKQSFTNGTGITLLGCPAGTFTMGSPSTETDRRDNEDQHPVTLTGFWLGKTEVTQAEWTTVMGSNPSSRKDPGKPVETVTWEDAMQFCRRLTDRERARGTLPPGWIYTLPTDAQWEYACRGGTSTTWSFGDKPTKLWEFGNYNDVTGRFQGYDTEHDDKEEFTAVVGKFKANPWGFHDMHGNVWEWCADWYEQNLGTDAVTDPPGPPSGSSRVLRGGSFDFSPADCRSAYRDWNSPSFRSSNLGIRVAAVLIPSSPEGKSANGGTE